MSDAFEADLLDELAFDAAEGPAQSRYDEFDEFDEDDEFDEGDEFLGRIVSGVGQAVGGLLGGDEFDEFDEMEDYMDEDAYDDEEGMDAFEDAVADALEEDDTDEFFRRLARIGRGVARAARRAAPVVGRIARTVAPIASAIPIPQAQAIGRIAGLLGRALPNRADEFEAFEDVMDLAEEEDAVDAAAPLIAGLTIRRTMPGIARAPRATRRRMVRSVARATRTVARRQGPQAARAVPAVVRTVQRAVRQRRVAPRAAPQAIRRVAQRVAASPRVARRLARAPAGGRRPVRGAGGRMRAPRNYTLRGPVRISIQGR